LSAAMITAAWQVADGVGDAIASSPETLPDTIGRIAGPVLWPIGGGLALLVTVAGWRVLRRIRGGRPARRAAT